MEKQDTPTQIISKYALRGFLVCAGIALLCVILFSSCVATKKQKERFLANNCQRKDSVSVVIKDTTIYRDTVVYIPDIQTETIYLENPCKLLCDSLGRLKPTLVIKTNKGLKSTVKSIGNSLAFDCKTDSLKARITTLEHQLIQSTFSHTESTVQQPCELMHRTKWDGFTWYWFWITLAYFIIRYGIKFIKSYFKL